MAAQPIRYPFEYFSAPFAFASRISHITGAPFWDSVAKYTPLHAELTGAAFQDQPNEAAWNTLMRSSAAKSWHELAHVTYALYLKQPYAAFDATWTPKGSTRFGALGVDTSAYNLDRNQVKLHFLPTRRDGSDLASRQLGDRRADMKHLLHFVKRTHPSIGYFTSFTWLQNLPTYQALFPPAFLSRLVVMHDKFLGVWGQFVRWDGTANTRNYDVFMTKLQHAMTAEVILDAIPLKVLGARGPIQEFYDLYEVK